MKYMGSKNRIAKEILPIILKDRKPNQCYVETMVGGGNLIDKVEGFRIGADLNPFVIEALIAIRDCVSDLPKNKKEFTEDEYLSLRKSDEFKYKGYAGFAFSYSGKWLGGWCRDGVDSRDYVREAYSNAVNQSPLLQGVKLIKAGYKSLQIPKNSIIYCDPPYEGTTKYKDGFNHSEFWEWVRIKSLEGHSVFVSEYNAPDDFICVWQKDQVSSLTKNTGAKKATEKLFIFNDIF